MDYVEGELVVNCLGHGQELELLLQFYMAHVIFRE